MQNSLILQKNDAIKSFFKIHKPDVTINCSAITDLDFCEKNKSHVLDVNALGAKKLAQACNVHNPPIHKLKPYSDTKTNFANTEEMSKRGLWLPSSSFLTEDDIIFISDKIKNLIQKE